MPLQLHYTRKNIRTRRPAKRKSISHIISKQPPLLITWSFIQRGNLRDGLAKECEPHTENLTRKISEGPPASIHILLRPQTACQDFKIHKSSVCPTNQGNGVHVLENSGSHIVTLVPSGIQQGFFEMILSAESGQPKRVKQTQKSTTPLLTDSLFVNSNGISQQMDVVSSNNSVSAAVEQNRIEASGKETLTFYINHRRIALVCLSSSMCRGHTSDKRSPRASFPSAPNTLTPNLTYDGGDQCCPEPCIHPRSHSHSLKFLESLRSSSDGLDAAISPQHRTGTAKPPSSAFHLNQSSSNSNLISLPILPLIVDAIQALLFLQRTKQKNESQFFQ